MFRIRGYYSLLLSCYEFDKNANSINMKAEMFFVLFSLATIGVCIFCAVTSVAVPFIFGEDGLMRIIALQGRGATGKTTTLKCLIDIVKNEPDFVLEDIVEGDDSQCWLSYNNIRIGITTRGDAAECLYADFFNKPKNFKDRDIVVCAIRTRGGTVDFVKKYGNDGVCIHGRWYLEGNQNVEGQRSTTHKLQAEAILTNIKDYIEELEA